MLGVNLEEDSHHFIMMHFKNKIVNSFIESLAIFILSVIIPDFGLQVKLAQTHSCVTVSLFDFQEGLRDGYKKIEELYKVWTCIYYLFRLK